MDSNLSSLEQLVKSKSTASKLDNLPFMRAHLLQQMNKVNAVHQAEQQSAASSSSPQQPVTDLQPSSATAPKRKFHETSALDKVLPNGKKTKGRVKIKMEFINNKLRRYTTFSKRKTGIMKKVGENY
jgi:hypothetical protein